MKPLFVKSLFAKSLLPLLAGLGLVAFSACAPSQQGKTAPSRSSAKVSIEVFPLKKGETWELSATSSDSESKDFTLKISKDASVEQTEKGDPVIVAEADAGSTYADLAYYPDDQFLFVVLPLTTNRDPNKVRNVICLFDEIASGKSRAKGLAFFGTFDELSQVKNRSGFGDCLLSKAR